MGIIHEKEAAGVVAWPRITKPFFIPKDTIYMLGKNSNSNRLWLIEVTGYQSAERSGEKLYTCHFSILKLMADKFCLFSSIPSSFINENLEPFTLSLLCS